MFVDNDDAPVIPIVCTTEVVSEISVQELAQLGTNDVELIKAYGIAISDFIKRTEIFSKDWDLNRRQEPSIFLTGEGTMRMLLENVTKIHHNGRKTYYKANTKKRSGEIIEIRYRVKDVPPRTKPRNKKK